jgi:hypothetical protein
MMALAFFAVLFYFDTVTSAYAKSAWPAPAMDPRLGLAILLTIAELMIVTAIAVFFSTFSSPLLSALLTFGLWVTGHFNADLRNFEAVLNVTPVVWMARALYYLLPNLAPFNIRAEVVHGVAVPGSQIALTLAYASVYIVVLLIGAIAIFRRRDFK